MPKIPIKDFHLEHTLSCGQMFRTYKKGKWHYVAARDRIFRVCQSAGQLEFQGVDREFLTSYFALDEPYPHILAEINKDSFINEAIGKYRGMRIVRQDAWECLISFLCSSAANIPKIKTNIESMSQSFGKKICAFGSEGYAFPNPGTLDDYDKIVQAKTGFRAKYIKAVNDAVDEPFLSSLKKMPYTEAKKALKCLPGVGDKIADCVLLFSLGFTEAFPVDTWMKKILRKWYFNNEDVPEQQLQDFGIRYFGKYTGYAQQFLYMVARESR